MLTKTLKYSVYLCFAWIVVPGLAQPDPHQLPPLTRAQIMATAERLAQHTWDCKSINMVARCPQAKPYTCHFQLDQKVTGIAYDWGGNDDPDQFDKKLADSLAAGSHSWHGVTACTAGIDCSGFVGYCWGQKKKFGTVNIREISARPKYNIYTDMKPGDALNKEGSHIVLFAGYKPDGKPIVYEAQGAAGRVILNQNRSWDSLKGYKPLQYLNVQEE